MESPLLAIFLVLAVVAMSGLESAYVQVTTTNQAATADLLGSVPFLLLFSLDLLVPLTVALLSKRFFILYLLAQCFLSSILLHYTIFFYNTLTLSTIYHSMQGAASLGIDILGFTRWDIIITLGFLLMLKLFLVRVSMVRRRGMPRIWKLRGAVAVACMMAICCVVIAIYGKTGLTLTWVEPKGHRPAAERRLEEGARESVRTIGYVATWLGEFFSGNYKDTTLIYAEARCSDPGGGLCVTEGGAGKWLGLPVPPLGETVVMIQAESLDFAAVDLRVNGRVVMPFMNYLAHTSMLLKVFAPHKVGSCNSDYEILNGRIAEQNVVYYTYINDYPDSVIHLLNESGYHPAVFHGLSGGLFNLRSAYEAQGFERFHFKEELLAEGYKPGPYIMEHVMDEDLFKNAADHLLSADGRRAQFIITMSSHVPFMKPRPEYKSVGGKFARYVSSLTYLDQQLAEYYARLPEGTVMIIWGDHGSDVVYPRGFEPGDREVPFLVHVKGETGWLSELRAEKAARNASLSATSREPSLTADGRTHNLCQLTFYLRCLFSQRPHDDRNVAVADKP
ncbi:hypothetical protein C4J81_06270 [Deltaproteobacteria bacterium Smac51]|nr:hypothetical protein C4J81_06270 [Deltaproteobacteria bacterium Smac51]